MIDSDDDKKGVIDSDDDFVQPPAKKAALQPMPRASRQAAVRPVASSSDFFIRFSWVCSLLLWQINAWNSMGRN